MFENLIMPEVESKQQRYNVLLKQIREIAYNEDDLVATLTNIAAILHHGMNFSRTGFYFVKDEELVLGPFQGPPARMHIRKGEGACGIAYTKECTIVVDDVEQFPGYIPCDDYDRSEIVIPAFRKGDIALLLSINSDKFKNFTEVDQKHLQQLVHLIEEIL